MEKFVKGDVVVLPFPFSDLSQKKNRPALVLANIEGEDLIVCQITSSRFDKYSVLLEETDFKHGSLQRNSFARPSKLFTISSTIITYKIGALKNVKLKQINNMLKSIF